MRKMFCTLGVGVWALCSQVMADAQSLLAKVPETYDFAVCIDTKQLDAGAFMVLDMLKASIPPKEKVVSERVSDQQSGWVSFAAGIEKAKVELQSMKDNKALYGISSDAMPYVCLAGGTKSGSAVILFETTVPEQKFVDFMKSEYGEIVKDQTVGGHIIYKVGLKELKSLNDLDKLLGDGKNPNPFTSGNPTAYFSYLDKETLMVAPTNKVFTEMQNFKGKPAHFLHQDDISRNPMIWFGSNENSDLSKEFRKESHKSKDTGTTWGDQPPEVKNFYGFVSLDQANSKITSEFNIEATNSESAMKVESMFQLYSGILTMTSQNPALIKDSFQITNRACKLFGKVKIDKEVCEEMAKMAAILVPKLAKNTPGNVEVKFGEIREVDKVKEVPASEKKGLTIKREE